MKQGDKATNRYVAAGNSEEDEQAKREIAALAAAVRRAQAALLEPSFCRDCWIDHGEHNRFVARSGGVPPRCSRGHEKYRR